MRKLFLALGLGAFMLTAVTVSVNAQDDKESKVIEAKGSSYDKSRGADNYIKTSRPAEDAPVAKPDESTRSSYCKVVVQNYSGYYADIYVDGNYKGTIAPWTEDYTWAISGKTQLYAVSSGQTVFWGPSYVDCGYSFTWQLYNP